MNPPQLTHNAISMMIANDHNLQPLVQVLEIKKQPAVGPAAERYHLQISDGSKIMKAVLAAQIHQVSNQITNTCIIRINDYLINSIDGNKAIIILQMEVLTESLNFQIGNPSIINQPNPPAVPRQYQPPPPVNDFDDTGNAIMPIKFLNTFQRKWTVKVRVTAKSELREWTSKQGKGNGLLASVDLLDAQGTEIRATMFNDIATKLFPAFQIGQVYIIRCGAVKPAQKRFSSLNNDYELHLDSTTEVTPCEEDRSIANVHYRFTPIDRIQYANKDSIIDVLGIVEYADQDVSQITIKSNGSKLSKRTIKLLDISGRSIDTTIWGEKAEKWSHNEFPIIAIRGAKVSDYNNKTLTTLSSSNIDIEPDIPEAHQLRQWFVSQGGQVQSHSLSINPGFNSNGNGNGNGNYSTPTTNFETARMTLGQVRDNAVGRGNSDKGVVFICKGIISKHKKEGPGIYDACPKPGCNKKVNYQRGGWFCEKCDQIYPNSDPRYTMTVNIADHTGELWITCFNEVATMILGHPAAHIAELRKNERTVEIEAIHKNSLFQGYVFKVRAKDEKYQDSSRVKCAIISAEPVDFIKEGKHLITEIRKYG